MNIELIKMTRDAAHEAFQSYRSSLKEKHSAEDAAVLRGYHELSKGSALLDLRSVLRAAGQDEKGRPKIAITRADFKWGWFSWLQGGRARFTGTNVNDHASWNVKSYKYNSVDVPAHALVPPADTSHRARALVPYIPPQYRPRAKLSNYHIMWEAEWLPVPPTDPFLLKHLGGTLYVVLAQWDLTPLEKAVLAGRLTT